MVTGSRAARKEEPVSVTGGPPPFARRIRSGIGWLALAQVVRRLSGLAVTAVLARLLAPEDFGLVALASLATQLLGIITELGLTTSLVQRRSVKESDLSTGFWLGFAFSWLLALAGFFGANLIGRIFRQPGIVPLLRVMMITLPIAAMGQIPDVILQRRLDFRRIAHVDWISGIASGILGIAAAFGGLGLWALVTQFLSATILTVVLRVIIVRWRPVVTFDRDSARRMVGFGSSLVAMGLVNYAAVNIDNALIGARIGAAALGYYMLAYNLVLLPSTNVGGLVSRVMFPALSSLQSDRQRFVQAYAGMLRVVAVATFPLVVGLGATAPIAIAAIYGPQWRPAVVLLEILTTIGIFQAVNVSGVAYTAIGRPRLLLAWATLSLVVMTIGFAIGSRWGVTGVAWSYLIVSPIVCLPPHLIANHLIGLRQRDFFRIVGVPLLGAAVMGVIVLLIRRQPTIADLSVFPQLAIVSAMGAIAYAGALLAFAFIAGARSAPFLWITRRPVTLSATPGET